MANPRKIGDKHVYDVFKALNLELNKKSITHYSKTVKETVKYIQSLYPNIISVQSKFQAENTNIAKDLTLVLREDTKVTVNLFLIKNKAKIQQKNLGAKSFFAKYFLSDHVQEKFNKVFEKHYLQYLTSIVELAGEKIANRSSSVLKKIVANHYPKFAPEMEEYRSKFLYNLREEAFVLLKDFYNERHKGFEHAYHSLFMTEDT